MRDTDYAQELATAAIGECRVERLHVKSLNQTEIRFSWWPDGKLANRPLDLTEHELLPLLQLAFEKRDADRYRRGNRRED